MDFNQFPKPQLWAGWRPVLVSFESRFSRHTERERERERESAIEGANIETLSENCFVAAVNREIANSRLRATPILSPRNALCLETRGRLVLRLHAASFEHWIFTTENDNSVFHLHNSSRSRVLFLSFPFLFLLFERHAITNYRSVARRYRWGFLRSFEKFLIIWDVIWHGNLIHNKRWFDAVWSSDWLITDSISEPRIWNLVSNV